MRLDVFSDVILGFKKTIEYSAACGQMLRLIGSPFGEEILHLTFSWYGWKYHYH